MRNREVDLHGERCEGEACEGMHREVRILEVKFDDCIYDPVSTE